MSESNASNSSNRRQFLKQSGLGLAAALVGAKFFVRPVTARAQSLVMVSESDAMAKSLGYVADAKKVDTKKWPKRAGAEGAKQYCYNCQFYQFTGDAKTSKAAPCTIFAGKGVAGQGWCNSWVQNPKVKG
jgi:hypothetical protein